MGREHRCRRCFFRGRLAGNADRIDAEVAGVKMERGYVVVDDFRTSVPHIFAAGDVTDTACSSRARC